DKWLDNRQDLLLGFLSRTVAVIRRAVTPSVSAPTILPEREWGGAGDPPPPPPAPSTPFLTPKRKKYAIGAAIVIALGTLYKKAPQWMKNRVKRILAEHGKTLADVTPAEQDLLISASYARFNPAGSFFFQEAVLDMPKGQTFREELWPVLYHVYYGKKKVGRKLRAELRKLYDEAQEMVGEL
ncbi:MAG TPA: hypothetical protein VI521_01510, partial [Candidatus Babeliales bacterium]|nr:hypothetical protein [Candidatus Babeliales bacterium]